MATPAGLSRARSTSTQSLAAATLSAPKSWHETPCARMMPFCLASASTSIAPARSSGHFALSMQCSSTMSRRSVPISERKRSRSARISAAVRACVFVRITTSSRFTVLSASLRVRVAAVLVGEVPETDAVVDAAHEQVGEPLVAHRADLVRALADAVGARALRKARHRDPGLAERHRVLRRLRLVCRVEMMGEPLQPEHGRAEAAVPHRRKSRRFMPPSRAPERTRQGDASTGVPGNGPWDGRDPRRACVRAFL